MRLHTRLRYAPAEVNVEKRADGEQRGQSSAHDDQGQQDDERELEQIRH